MKKKNYFSNFSFKKLKKKKYKKKWNKINVIFLSIIIIIFFLFIFLLKLNKKYIYIDPVIKQIEDVHSKKVSIKKKYNITINPININPEKGLILYSEKDVMQEAYIPLGTIISEKGYLVVISKFFINNPKFDINKINNIIDTNKNINNWVVGGHGKGGIFASKTLNYNNKIKGIFFLASYPDNTIKFFKKNLKIYSIIGNSDNLLSIKEWKQRNINLPKNTVYTIIEKGNHSYYANYKEENTEITKEEQQLQTAVQLLNLLDEIK